MLYKAKFNRLHSTPVYASHLLIGITWYIQFDLKEVGPSVVIATIILFQPQENQHIFIHSFIDHCISLHQLRRQLELERLRLPIVFTRRLFLFLLLR